MARIRTIKPEFWTDEKPATCSMLARLLFIATWNFADDHGGLDRSAKQLKAQAFPHDDIDCEPAIQELLNARLLIEYEVDGKKYLHVTTFRKHQKNEKPAAPRFPIYGGGTATSSGSTESTSGATERSSGSYIREGMIRESTTAAACGRSPVPSEAGQPKTNGKGKPRGHLVPFPVDFVLTDTMREQALKRCSDCDVEQWFELFRAHHMAHGKAMKSWCAAWITWIGNGQKFGYPKRKEEPRANRLPVLNA